ncbi:MAG: exodeoxyribonuclease VII large subunit [Gammaproteobacteria bacterium]|nr:exodeoxyribonuclease VII large subunit [Gammaproteobacteria bacterium]
MIDYEAQQDNFSPKRDILTVSRLNREVRTLLEGSFPLMWIEGEISNFACPSSGHWYLTLKDHNAQVRCAMFRNRNQLCRFKPVNGLQVLVRAKVGLYEGRGEFQLIAEHMEEAGDGALRREFDELKAKLDKEGLFDPSIKKDLPALPKCIGVITSPTGAAVHDVLSVLNRRFPALPVIIYPVPVQGETAAKEIASTIKLATSRKECDVLLITRGGGSLEDLWAFNEEVLARAIYKCPLPVVSAVGHEIDFTIADFVADYRAPTPSAAAEYLSPHQDEWNNTLNNQLNTLKNLLLQTQQQAQKKLMHLDARLQQCQPGFQLKQAAQKLDNLELRYQNACQNKIENSKSITRQLSSRLLQLSPSHKIKAYNDKQQQLSHLLQQAIKQKIKTSHLSLSSISRALDTISPLSTLDRGYSILRKEDRSVIKSTQQIQAGESIHAQLADGKLKCIVEETS